MHKEIDYTKLRLKIKEMRTLRGYTQEALAESVGCNTSHISNIENNHTKVSVVFCSLKSPIIISSCDYIRRFIICAAIVIINRITYFIIVYQDHSIDIIFLRL